MPLVEIPEKYKKFVCPITHHLIEQPTEVDETGQLYELSAIQKWYAEQKRQYPHLSPLIPHTGERAKFTDLKISYSSLKAIKEFKEEYQICEEKDFLKVFRSRDAEQLKKYHYLESYYNNDKAGLKPLHLAVINGSLELTMELLNNKADIEIRDDDGNTALHRATSAGHYQIVKRLLNAKANIEAKCNSNCTALFFAAKENRLNIAELLIQEGANIEATCTSESYTPLLIAAKQGHCDMVRLLLDKKANGKAVANPNKFDLSLSHVAVLSGSTALVELLVQRGLFDVNAVSPTNATPLYVAVTLGSIPLVHLLLQLGAKVDINLKDKRTLLHIAVEKGHYEIVKLLLDNDASVDATTDKLETALHIAAQNKAIEIVKLLLAYGAFPEAQSKTGETPIEIGQKQSKELAQLFNDYRQELWRQLVKVPLKVNSLSNQQNNFIEIRKKQEDMLAKQQQHIDTLEKTIAKQDQEIAKLENDLMTVRRSSKRKLGISLSDSILPFFAFSESQTFPPYKLRKTEYLELEDQEKKISSVENKKLS